MYEYRCDEILKAKVVGSSDHTSLHGLHQTRLSTEYCLFFYETIKREVNKTFI
jgi:hypothetical protein